MRVTALFISLAALVFVTVTAAPAPEPLLLDLDLGGLLGVDWSEKNHYNAPLICKLLQLLPKKFHCPKPLPPHQPPPPSDGYTPTFQNLTGATQGDDYLTFGLVDTVADCKAMCNSVAGCGFVNTYHDVNGKDGSTQLTCSLFRGCHTAADATNTGGQTQPDGSVNYIRESSGWCKQ
ncbi:hypothetical protein NMY22_g19731 [Coprinellus aureogranulatus]|nr:hypothetical protein NMY22_g19731 [Coprinellus aureogranulatus]